MATRARSRRTTARSVRSHLIAFAFGVAAPILIFAALVLAQFTASVRDTNAERVLHDAERVSTAVDRQVDAMLTALDVLSTSPLLETGDFGAFHQRVQVALAGTPLHVFLLDRDMQQQLNTRVPWGTPLGKTSDPRSAETVFRTGRPLISDVFFGTVAQNPVITVLNPVKIDDEVRYVLGISRDARSLQTALTEQADDSRMNVAVVDRNRSLIVRTELSGTPSDAEIPAVIANRLQGFEGAFVFETDDARRLLYAYRSSALTGWTSIVWVAVSDIEEPLRRAWITFLIGGAGLVAVSLLLAMSFGKRLGGPIRAIAHRAKIVGRGETVQPLNSTLREANDVAAALADASVRRMEQEQQLRLILRELAHRSKNLLAIIQSIARQTADQADDMKDFNTRFTARLRSLAHSQDLLVNQNWRGVNLRELVVSQLAPFIESEARLDIIGPEAELKPDAVQNIGLALHELATNASKYGALSRPTGKVTIDWQPVRTNGADELRLRWQESGGPTVKPPVRKGFGRVVIEDLVSTTLNGRVKLDYDREGLRWSVWLPASLLLSLPEEAPPDEPILSTEGSSA